MTDATGARARSLLRPALGLAATLVLAACCARIYFLVSAHGAHHVLDDPMITLRVAANLWHHGVPHFNPGEAVAANTSLAWPVLLAPVFGIVPDPEGAVLVLFHGSTALWCGIAVWMGMREPRPAVGIATTGFLALGFWAQIYGGSVWEHVPQAALVTAALVPWLDRDGTGARIAAFWLLGFAFMIRPDAAPLVAGFALHAVATLRGPERRRFLRATLPALVLPAAHLAGMLHWYGDVVPNTLYLKVGQPADRALEGLRSLVDPTAAGPVPALAVLGLLLWRRLAARERVVLGLALLQMAYVASVGGDVYGHGRFLLLLLPVLAAIVLRRLAGALGEGLAVVMAAAAVAASLFAPAIQTASALARIHIRDQLGPLLVARAVLAPADGSVGLFWLGLGYHMVDFHVVDFLGKADLRIARLAPRGGRIGHDRWDFDYSLTAHDIAVVPLLAAPGGVSPAGQPADGGPVTGPRPAELADAIEAAGRHVWIAPQRFCFATAYGLYLRADLVPRLAAAARDDRQDDGQGDRQNGRCLGLP